MRGIDELSISGKPVMNETSVNSNPKRALVLAGGGLKVALQAGVLQVWLDEAEIEFDHADGASGGTFNLAMYCQGMSGIQIADNWRNLPIGHGISFNWTQYVKLFKGASLFTYEKWRKNVFTAWGLDFESIRASDKSATFSVYNYTDHRLETLSPSELTEDFLVACVSLPMWFPPVTIDDKIYIDPVYLTDANLMDAIDRGADELWIIWTVGEKPEWRDGFVANYFQIIETTANGHFRQDLRRIEENNAATAVGRQGEFGRHIELRILKAEVPLHYLINLSEDRFKESVNLGVDLARNWCRDHGIPLEKEHRPESVSQPTQLQFTEEMKGYVTLDETDYDTGFAAASHVYLMVHLTIKVDDVDHFVTNPKHEGTVEGFVSCDAFGGRCAVQKGGFNLFIDAGDPTRKRMLYRLFFTGDNGQAFTLTGFKDVKDDPGMDIWSDTSTLFTRILAGHVAESDEPGSKIVAAGIIRILMLDFLKQLTTFRTEGPSVGARASGLTRFGVLFLGKLWDVYANRILKYGPF